MNNYTAHQHLTTQASERREWREKLAATDYKAKSKQAKKMAKLRAKRRKRAA